MCCRIFQFNVARKGQKIFCRCEHTYTHMCFRTSQFKVAPQNQEVYKGLANQVLTHVCPRINKLRVAGKDLGIKKYKGFGADQLLL